MFCRAVSPAKQPWFWHTGWFFNRLILFARVGMGMRALGEKYARSNEFVRAQREMRAFKQICARSIKNARATHLKAHIASNLSIDNTVLSIRRSFANQIGLITAQPHGENRVRKTREIFHS